MNDFTKLIGIKEILAGLAVLIVGGVFTIALKWCRDKRDGKKIYSFLLQSKKETDWIFRSSHAISSHTKISECRVEAICSTHPKIKRNEKEKQSWKVEG